ncbi:Transposase DDE domain protein [Chryseobacterium sp. MOF25P]|uniref:IS1182 family transposase n=1 Tax=unclassified Chryseobacterium TaxID=2593645 RepID=UPI000805B047|nr:MULTISPECIES: IS1182 family transposase [unclassified Chryseobacterium]OBW39917.1 Transposase DDE domain protein [Chryseobacterium sp. MOF25P]OBW43759.1 Transposase DDE domain protein [Chryseobacterium sp. BGARF1]
MQGKKIITPQLFYHQSLDEMVPEDNFYRKVNENLSLDFLYKATASYYGKCGQESIDPVVFFRILIVGYLNNMNSDRALIRFCSNCLDIRLFLGYDFNENLPFHSTISRTRSLFGEELFLELFRSVLSLCIGKGMVRGKRMAVDSAFIKANASMDSLVEKEVLEDVSAFVNELEENSEFKTTSTRKKLVDRHHSWKEKEYKGMPGNTKSDRKDEDGNEIRPKYLSNHTHYSSTDPDAKISVKPGKARQLNYSGQLTVDDANHVIVGACASSSGSKDSVIFPEIMNQTIENFKENKLEIDEVLADAGYSSGSALKYCQEKGLNAYIPNFGQYKSEREGFIFNKEEDRYECQKDGGNKAFLPFKRILTDSKGYDKKSYRSSEKNCSNCPLRTECCGKVTKFKKIEDSIHKPLYDAMHEKLKRDPHYTRFLTKRRSSRVEPVLGTLINYHSMKKVNCRGIKNANKHVLMAALTYNLKKYLKFITKKVHRNIQLMNLPKGKFWFFPRIENTNSIVVN